MTDTTPDDTQQATLIHPLRLRELEAAETERDRLQADLYVCPDCAFTFHADHTNTDGSGYSCPNCAEAALVAEVERLQKAQLVQARRWHDEHDRAVHAQAEVERLRVENDAAMAVVRRYLTETDTIHAHELPEDGPQWVMYDEYHARYREEPMSATEAEVIRRARVIDVARSTPDEARS